MATTNGTAAMLKAASTGAPVLVACARNASAALDEALSRGRRVGIFCSGRKGRPAWDDTLCAGLLVAYLAEHFPDIRLADSARLAHLTWTNSKDFKSSLMSADHAVFLEKIGFGDDVTYAGEIDVTRIVPELHEIPEGDDMRVVLRPVAPGAPRYLSNRRPPVASDLRALVGETALGRPDLPAAQQDDGLFRHLLNTGAENVFFAGRNYKKSRKGKFVKS
jgi:hypothetical protein